MPSPNDGSATTLPSDDGTRYVLGGWDPLNSVWRALKVAADRTLFILRTKGTSTTSQVTATTTSGTLLAANTSRKIAMFYNVGPNTVYLKSAAGAVAATDYPLVAGAEYVDDDTTTIWTGITATGTADVRVREVA